MLGENKMITTAISLLLHIAIKAIKDSKLISSLHLAAKNHFITSFPYKLHTAPD